MLSVVAGTQMEGHPFSEDGDPCHSFNRHATRGRLQDRGLSQAGSARLATIEGPVELATAESIPNRRGLGIRQPTQQRQTALLARFAPQGALGTSGERNRN